MSSPTGAVISTITQSKRSAKRFFWILTAFGVLLGLLFLAVAASSKESGSVYTSLFCAVLPFIGLFFLGRSAFRSPRKLEVYQEGFILRDSVTDDVLESALWTEVRDITFSETKKKSNSAAVGQVLFGIIGGIIASAITDSGPGDDRDVVIHIGKKNIKIDTNYNEPELAARVVSDAARAAWTAAALRDLEHGQNVEFANVTLHVAGVTQGKVNVDWSAVLNAEHVNDRLVSISWNNPAKSKPQTMKVTMGYRGDSLVQVVRQKIGKPSSMASRLGKL